MTNEERRFNQFIFMLFRAAYHSSLMDDTISAKALIALLPLFREHANTPAMIHHAMLLIRKQTHFLNQGQIPLMTVDQPLFALAKTIQWAKPDVFGEDKLVVMMGDLHIEMTFMKCLGIILHWTLLEWFQIAVLL